MNTLTDQRGTAYQAHTKRQAYARIKGRRYPVECISSRKHNGYTVVTVRVLPREDGFQPRPFVHGAWSAPWVLSEEGEVLADNIDVQWIPTKRVVLVDNGRERFIDSDFCPHLNTVMQMTEDEMYLQCLDCGFVEREDGSWGPEELPEDDQDYPDMYEELK